MTDKPEINDEVEKLISSIEEKNRLEAERKANKLLSKNKRELNRLYKHAQIAAENNNFAQYEYAIKKSRDILKQPYNDELISILWKTTRSQIEDMIDAYTCKIQAS
ncbi:tail completion protein [Escherichia phage ADUt]|uniref:Uncharacterized protein n=2 Tax=Tequatrovirus TaxID=10663 RepID=A0A4Y6E915_9CAUD|nr:DUF2654 domain-containing protein [Shigella flexneri]EKC7973840.1 a-gt.4 family protein [Escherichia coli]QDF15089.1 hypothetical protein Sa45lw_64 [Escherichia phage vB_EcoM-Sa45lw]UKH47461.1 MAG: hypothetical protein [Shigella phage RP1]WAK44031.1 hypothetical protein [Escherichia virus CAM-21]WFG41858.1 tail completion protein [Escherichia phage ADUt]WRO06398.1 hypothetical protein JY01_169 [Escherichia phage JY01]